VSPLYGFLIGLVLVGTLVAVAHGAHYRERRMQFLEAEVETLRKIVSGQHGRLS
jgi:hypothetical protein